MGIVYTEGIEMAKGRKTSVLTVRLPDELATSLRNEARMRKILLNEYLKSILTTRGLLEPEPKKELPEDTEVTADLQAGGVSISDRVFKASPSSASRQKARLKKRKDKGKRKHSRH